MADDAFRYQGDELDLFAKAHHWKAYLADMIGPYLGTDVAEVGAGLGATTRVLCTDGRRRWLCLEPDGAMAGTLETERAAGRLPACCRVQCATLRDLPASRSFDTILYVDVLEHIADDRGELAEAARRLSPGGRIVVLSPAHSWLFSPFDSMVGHHRRYTIPSLREITPPSCRVEKALYLDSAGLLASAANRLLLRSAMPTEGQIAFWDGCLVPVSRQLDRVLAHRLGKSVLMIWAMGPVTGKVR
jgi:SAM-dependent methyltransferase